MGYTLQLPQIHSHSLWHILKFSLNTDNLSKAISCSCTCLTSDLFLLPVDAMDIPLLRQQQIRLGLLKAARVLFSQQENLRQIMARPASAEGDQYSLFQQLLSAATRPSPIKAMFTRDELEVGV